ncbi:DUF1150 family protein [Pseudomonadota bacterium]
MNRNPTHAYTALGSDPEQYWLAHFDLANWGIEDVAYVKAVDGEGDDTYGIFAADGTELALVESREEAIVTIRQNELEALSVH